MTLEQAIAFALKEPPEKVEKRPVDASKSRLTAREIEVLSLVAGGLSDAEVVEKLDVSPRTVGGNLRGLRRLRGLRDVYGKLGVKRAVRRP